MEQEDSLHFSDLTFYRLQLYVNLLITTVANSLGIWLILYASPKHMRVYRWFLLDILLSAFCMDFYLFTILQPLILLPVLGYCPLGFARYGGTFFGGFISLLILIFLLGCFTASSFSASTFRLLSVYNLQHKFLSPQGFWSIFCLHLFITAPLQIVVGFVIKEIDGDWQVAIRDKMAQLHPSIKKILDSNEICVFGTLEIAEVQVLIYFAICLMVIVGIVGVGIIVLGFYSLVVQKNKYSKKLYQMHMQLSFSLLGQLMVPIFTLLIPFFIMAFSFLFKLSFIEDLAQFYVMTFSMHSTLNALAMILFTRPYRDSVRKWLTQRILRPFMKNNKVVPKTDDPLPKTIAMATKRIDGQNQQKNEMAAGIKTIMVKEKVKENGAMQIVGGNIRRKGGSIRRIIGHSKNPMDGRQSVPITFVG